MHKVVSTFFPPYKLWVNISPRGLGTFTTLATRQLNKISRVSTDGNCMTLYQITISYLIITN